MLDGYDTYLKHLLKLIGKHGWAIQSVLAGDDSNEPPFVYTVGLTTFGHPELLVYGLCHHVGPGILNTLGERVRKGERLVPGTTLRRVIGDDLRVGLIEARDNSDLILAHHLYPEVEAIQVLWPDPQGRLPWEGGFSSPRSHQPYRGPVPKVFVSKP